MLSEVSKDEWSEHSHRSAVILLVFLHAGDFRSPDIQGLTTRAQLQRRYPKYALVMVTLQTYQVAPRSRHSALLFVRMTPYSLSIATLRKVKMVRYI
jgi:hypothetical protein